MWRSLEKSSAVHVLKKAGFLCVLFYQELKYVPECKTQKTKTLKGCDTTEM